MPTFPSAIRADTFNYPHYLKQAIVPVLSNYQLKHSILLFFSVSAISKSIAKKVFMCKAPSDRMIFL